MSECWYILVYPDWYEHFKRIWGELELSWAEMKKTIEMWKYGG